MPRIRVRDIGLHYEEVGAGEPLLFIHGLGSSGRDWEMQVPFFASEYRVVVFDLRGHGESDKPRGPYTMPQFAEDTAGLIEALGIAPAHVVGISLGGMIAFQLAIDRPDLVRSLVIVNSGPEFVARTFRERLAVLQRFLVVRLVGMRKMGEILAPRLFPKPEQGALREMLVERWAANDPRAYRDAMRAIVGWSVADRLGEIDIPTLVVAADEDYTPVSTKEAYVAKIPRAELAVIRDARHAVPVERPDEFNAAVGAFLARQRG
ncbi:MAG: alpha/beta hydrolase [Anaerolineae bacterium]|jgi:pimeloyl-ACP methyl ester carboxylesterase|nr:alpha/beta hydrolase [Anaerolineae bacterium]